MRDRRNQGILCKQQLQPVAADVSQTHLGVRLNEFVVLHERAGQSTNYVELSNELRQAYIADFSAGVGVAAASSSSE